MEEGILVRNLPVLIQPRYDGDFVGVVKVEVGDIG